MKSSYIKFSLKKSICGQDSLLFSVFNRKLFASTVRKNIESFFGLNKMQLLAGFLFNLVLNISVFNTYHQSFYKEKANKKNPISYY